MATKRIEKFVNSDSGLNFTFASGNIAYADYSIEEGIYGLSFHQSEWMPAYKTESFDSIEALAKRMKELSGDLRKWSKTIREEA